MTNIIRILVADDHAVVRAGLKALLNHQENMEVVVEASDGREAIAKAKQFKPDVAVLDIRMPNLNGIEACRQIREAVPSCQVIILTSYAEDELLADAIDAGASGYVLKRIGDDELIHAVERVSQGEGILDPAMTQNVFAELQKSRKSKYADAFSDLTSQELTILSLIAEGMTNKQIAAKLYLGEGTVRNYVSSVLSKIHVSNRAEAAAFAVTNHIEDVVPPAMDD